MKKLIFSALVATALCVSSCGKDDDNGGGRTSLNGIGIFTAILMVPMETDGTGQVLTIVLKKLIILFRIKK